MAVQMRYGDYVKQSWEIVKANIGPSIVFTIACFFPIVNLGMPIWMCNFMAAIKAAKNEGKPIQIGDIFNFENAADKWLGPFLASLAYMCCVIPGMIVAFTPCIIADKPGTPFMSAIKGALQFGKANIVPMILVCIVCGVVIAIGQILCVLPVLITFPIGQAAMFLAYEDHRAAVESAAAEGGIQL
jgi:uncharacterized membrane protein